MAVTGTLVSKLAFYAVKGLKGGMHSRTRHLWPRKDVIGVSIRPEGKVVMRLCHTPNIILRLVTK